MKRLFTLLAAACLTHGAALAQSWPDKPTRFMVPFPGGDWGRLRNTPFRP